MRTRDKIDSNYLKNLLQTIQQKLKFYLDNNTHWWGYSDPDQINPKLNLLQVEDLTNNINQYEQDINNCLFEIMQRIDVLLVQLDLLFRGIAKNPAISTSNQLLENYKAQLEQIKNALINLFTESPIDNNKVLLHLQQMSLLTEDPTNVLSACGASLSEFIKNNSRNSDKEVVESLKLINELSDDIDYKTKKFFETYYLILTMLNQCSKNNEIKEILITELKTQLEAQWDSMSKDEATAIKKSFKILDEEVIYDSTEHKQFCKRWGVTDQLKDYSIWIKMQEQMKKELDEGNYHKIPTLMGLAFGVVTASEEEAELSAYEKQRLKKELSIWTYNNIIKYFTDYMVDYALKNTNADVEKKGSLIKNNVLEPLLIIIKKARSNVGLERGDESLELVKYIRIFYNATNLAREPLGNVQQIMVNKDNLKSEYTMDFLGHINFNVSHDALKKDQKLPTQDEISGLVKKQTNEVNLEENKIYSISDFTSLAPHAQNAFAGVGNDKLATNSTAGLEKLNEKISFNHFHKTAPAPQENKKPFPPYLKGALKGSGFGVLGFVGLLAFGGGLIATGIALGVPIGAPLVIFLLTCGLKGSIALGIGILSGFVGVGALLGAKLGSLKHKLKLTKPDQKHEAEKASSNEKNTQFVSTFAKLHKEYGDEIGAAAKDKIEMDVIGKNQLYDAQTEIDRERPVTENPSTKLANVKHDIEYRVSQSPSLR